MGVLLLQFRKMNLLQEQNNVEYQLLDLNLKRQDYQDMASTLGNDSITMTDIAGLPASLFAAGVDSLSYMNQQATQYANGVMANMQNASVFSQYGNNAAQMQQIAYMKAYEQGMEQHKKRILAQLNEKDKEMSVKQARLEARATAIDAQLQHIDKRLEKAIEQSTAKFGVSA